MIMKLKYLVTGTGRSGTVYMARLLTSVGVPCAHEAIFNWRGLHSAKKVLRGEQGLDPSYVSRAHRVGDKWNYMEPWLNLSEVVAESSYLAAPFLADPVLEGVPVIHVIRDPVKVVHSFTNYLGYFRSAEGSNGYEHFIYRHVPELKKELPQYDRACLFWVRWNQMVTRSNPAIRYRVEDDAKPVLEFLGKFTTDYFKETTINTFRKQCNDRFTLDKIRSKEIKDEFVALGAEYGYKLRSEYLLM